MENIRTGRLLSAHFVGTGALLKAAAPPASLASLTSPGQPLAMQFAAAWLAHEFGEVGVFSGAQPQIRSLIAVLLPHLEAAVAVPAAAAIWEPSTATWRQGLAEHALQVLMQNVAPAYYDLIAQDAEQGEAEGNASLWAGSSDLTRAAGAAGPQRSV
ncbi:MAG: hypothetical protein EOO40_13300, partial [Deltaproteobacteria bacterium]